MDHVISNLQNWKRVFEETGEYPNAVRCIDNAISELYKYTGERVVYVPVDKEGESQDDLR